MRSQLYCLILSFVVNLSCSNKKVNNQSVPDSLVTVSEVVSVHREDNYTQPESPPILSRWDSLYEHNTSEGILNIVSPLDPTVKLFIYPFDFYDEPQIAPGETLTGIFPSLIEDSLTLYRTAPIVFSFDSSTKKAAAPLISEDEKKWPLFLLKGISLDQVKGRQFPNSFFEPGDSLKITLNNCDYTFYVEGKVSESVVLNYRLILESTVDNKKHKEILFGRHYMPFPNTSDIIPDFIFWTGDLNNDGLLDLISGDGVKTCASYVLWMGAKDFKFIKATQFSGCGC